MTRIVELFASIAGETSLTCPFAVTPASETSASDTRLSSSSPKKRDLVDVEDGIPFPVLRQRENGLRGLYDLAGFQIARGDHARRFCAQRGIAKGVFRRSERSFRCFEHTFCGSQSFLRLIVDRPRGETACDQRLLPFEGRPGHAQLGSCGYDRCGRGIDIGLLLGRIEQSQDLASLDVSADIDIAREHASVDAEREVGAKAGLDFAGQGDGGLPVARLNDLRAHDRGTRDRSSGVIVAATQRDCDKRERKTARNRRLAFAGSSIDFGLVRGVMFHDTSMKWRGDNNSPSTSAAGRAETGWAP